MPRLTSLILSLPWLAALATGCAVFEVDEQQEKIAAFCRLAGRVSAESGNPNPLVVVLIKHQGGASGDEKHWRTVDHFVLEGPGGWYFVTGPGRYVLTGFEDVSGDLIYQPDEPGISIDLDTAFICPSGEEKEGIDLLIRKHERIAADAPVDIQSVQARTPGEQIDVTLGQVTARGKVASLRDARFSEKNAKNGLWRPLDFILENGPGVYFLEPYSAEKTPVLFVHGINGTPTNFTYLIEHLDRKRFQPWVFYYPSGMSIANIAKFLHSAVHELRVRHRFEKLAVVAHSMGGLVSRSFILQHAENSTASLVPLLITIATPWNGHTAAQWGVDYAPTPVKVWHDLAPDSAFLTGLFYGERESPRKRLKLPATTRHHLVFTFLDTVAGDGTVSLISQLRLEAQEEATRLYGINQSHVGVLNVPETAKRINRLLKQMD